jgi:hypothetical protein
VRESHVAAREHLGQAIVEEARGVDDRPRDPRGRLGMAVAA